MLSHLRNRFGIPGMISVIALVFAMLGGAYAANNSDGGKATASAKAKAGPRGPRGKTGPAGPAGPAGPQGPAGPTGPAGANGKDGSNGKDGANGTNGAPGANGKSVTVTAVDPGFKECEERGGTIVEVQGEPATATEVCNGEEGPAGPGGSPWTLGGTLPPGKTETGTWSFNASSVNGEKIFAPISFTIPLAGEPLFAEHVHFQGLPTPAAFEAACPGGEFGVGEPTADPGELCVYIANPLGEADALVNATFVSINPPYQLGTIGSGKAGAVLWFSFSGGAGEPAHGFGTWAVTG